LLVPLPGRAARVLQLAALKEPGEPEARELAGRADPRATAFFFRSGPAATWLPLLHEHAPHLLAADQTAGAWPTAPLLEHLATALGALLRLADAGALTRTPADVVRPLVLSSGSRFRPTTPQHCSLESCVRRISPAYRTSTRSPGALTAAVVGLPA
jgi:hypothetical protein